MKTVRMTAADVAQRTARFDAYGPGVLDEVKKIGLTFDAGIETAST